MKIFHIRTPESANIAQLLKLLKQSRRSRTMVLEDVVIASDDDDDDDDHEHGKKDDEDLNRIGEGGEIRETLEGAENALKKRSGGPSSNEPDKKKGRKN